MRIPAHLLPGIHQKIALELVPAVELVAGHGDSVPESSEMLP